MDFYSNDRSKRALVPQLWLCQVALRPAPSVVLPPQFLMAAGITTDVGWPWSPLSLRKGGGKEEGKALLYGGDKPGLRTVPCTVALGPLP